MTSHSRKPSIAGTLPRAAVACALLFSLHTALAANLEFLHDTPLSYLKQKDIDSVSERSLPH